MTVFGRRRDTLEREAERIGALAVRGDVTVPRDLERAVEQTLAAFGGLDILVWNSGGPPPGAALDVTPEAIEDAVALLLQPLVRLVHLCMPHLDRERGGAHPRDHVDRGEGARVAHRALEHAPSRRHRLAEDARRGARPAGDHRQLRRPRPLRHRTASRSSIPMVRAPQTSPTSRCAAGASRASSATSCASSRATARATSPGRRSSSTAGSSGRCSDAPPGHCGADRGRARRSRRRGRDRPLSRPVERLPPPAGSRAPGRAARARAGRTSGEGAGRDLLRRRLRAAREPVRVALPVHPLGRDGRAGEPDRPARIERPAGAPRRPASR